MAYPETVKTLILSRVLSGELTTRQAARQYGLSKNTVWLWKRRYLSAHNGKSENATETSTDTTPMKKLELPDGWSYLKAYGAVTLMTELPPELFGEYCRCNGLLTTTVSDWKLWFDAHPDAIDISEVNALHAQHQKDRSALTKREKTIADQVHLIEKKEKEIIKKDKALAEYAALLVLSKKAHAIWGDKGDA